MSKWAMRTHFRYLRFNSFPMMSFDPNNYAFKIRESIWDSNSQYGSSLRSVKVNSLTFFALLGAREMTPGSPSWPATFQPLALVANSRLGLQQSLSWVFVNHLSVPCSVVEKNPEVDLCQILAQTFMCIDPCRGGRGKLAAHHRPNEHWELWLQARPY
jgi:hypothetical protein